MEDPGASRGLARRLSVWLLVAGLVGVIVAASGCIEDTVETIKEKLNISEGEQPLPDQFYSQKPPGTLPPEEHPGYYAAGAANYAELRGGDDGLYDACEIHFITKYNRFPTEEEYRKWGIPNLPGSYWYGKQFFEQVPIGTPLYTARYKDPATNITMLMWSYEKILWRKVR